MPSDPTQTLHLRNLFAKAIQLRYLRVSEKTKAIYEDVFNDYETFENINLKDITDFRVRIGDSIGTIFGSDQQDLPDWAKKFIKQAYMRGIYRTRKDLQKNLPKLKTDYLYSGRSRLPIDKVKLPKQHRIRLETIYERNFTNLKSMSNDSAAFVTRVIDNGIVNGLSIEEVAQNLNKPGNLQPIKGLQPSTEHRALLIARTEMTRTHNLAHIEEAYLLEAETDTENVMGWRTILDGRERTKHREYNGKVFSKEIALKLVGDFNCRCGLFAVIRQPHHVLYDANITPDDYVKSF